MLTWTGSTAFTWYQNFKNLFFRFPKNALVFHFVREGENSSSSLKNVILDHIFGPSSGTLGPIPKKILRDNLPIMAGYRSNFQPSRSKNVGGVALERNKMACII